MCFSAQIEMQFDEYVKMTGAEIDYDQFKEIYGAGVSDASIKPIRALDLRFARPKNAAELELRNLVMQLRAVRIAKLDEKIKEQRELLAAAQAKMATKPTKAAAKDLEVKPRNIKGFENRKELLQKWEPTVRDDRVYSFESAPIVMMVDGKPKVRLARYHCRQNGMPASIDKEKDGLYNARRNNLDRWWRNEFGSTHALLLVRSFYENVRDAENKNKLLHFTPNPAGLMLIACVYSVWQDPAGGRPLLSFAAVTDEPPPEVKAAGHDRMIINIQPENVHRWLTPEGRSDDELQAILSDRQRPYYAHEVLAA